MSINPHNYVLIIAGGSGTRLWPVSRRSRPKQFQSFVDERTLLQNMVDLNRRVVPIEQIFIMATPEFQQVIQEQIPDLPAKNLLYEPCRRDNGPAATLAMIQIHKHDPKAVVAMLWSDHVITAADAFQAVLLACFVTAHQHPEAMVSVGAKPTSPDTGLGYMQIGTEVENVHDLPVYEVKKSIEKPDLATAKRFVSSWEYLWNVGYNVMQASSFLSSLIEAQPELEPVIKQLGDATSEKMVAEAYEQFPKQALDYMLVLHLKHRLVIPADIGWCDIGNWNVLHDILKETTPDQLVTKGRVTTLESSNSLIFAKDRLIATVGIKDLIIVDDGDVLLVMHKDSAQAIKLLNQTLEDLNPELL